MRAGYFSGLFLLFRGCMGVAVKCCSDGLCFNISFHYGRFIRIFCVCFAVCTGIVGVKWHQEAAVRYHAQDGFAGTP